MPEATTTNISRLRAKNCVTGHGGVEGNGIQIGSVNDGRHAPGSYHYSDQAFDVPAAQVPMGQEQALSRRVRGNVADVLRGGTGGGMGGLDQMGDIAGLEQQLGGVVDQMKAFKDAMPQMEANNLEEFILKSTDAFRQQTASMEASTNVLKNRNRLMMEGVPDEFIDREVKLNETARKYREILKPLNDALKAAPLTLTPTPRQRRGWRGCQGLG